MAILTIMKKSLKDLCFTSHNLFRPHKKPIMNIEKNRAHTFNRPLNYLLNETLTSP